jgi:hypothetical protein
VIEEAFRQEKDRITPYWIKPLLDLEAFFQRINKVKMDPFRQTIAALKQNIVNFAGTATVTFANFFSDLVSGQEGAGKRFLAALLGMLGQMFVQLGVFLIQSGLAHVILSSVFPYSLWLRPEPGYRAMATGAILAAAGGALIGASSALTQQNAQTAASGETSSSGTTSSSSTSSGPQVIRVGAPGRAQDEGSVGSAPQPQLITIKVESNDSHIVRVVDRNIKNNGQLRLAVQGATA